MASAARGQEGKRARGQEGKRAREQEDKRAAPVRGKIFVKTVEFRIKGSGFRAWSLGCTI